LFDDVTELDSGCSDIAALLVEEYRFCVTNGM
jgi:hypothetical protein